MVVPLLTVFKLFRSHQSGNLRVLAFMSREGQGRSRPQCSLWDSHQVLSEPQWPARPPAACPHASPASPATWSTSLHSLPPGVLAGLSGHPQGSGQGWQAALQLSGRRFSGESSRGAGSGTTQGFSEGGHCWPDSQDLLGMGDGKATAMFPPPSLVAGAVGSQQSILHTEELLEVTDKTH